MLLRVLFLPVSVLSGLLAGLLARKLFDVAWGQVSEEDPPEPEHREASWGRLTLALALEGAAFRITSGLVNRATRAGFFRATGRWPGEEDDGAEVR